MTYVRGESTKKQKERWSSISNPFSLNQKEKANSISSLDIELNEAREFRLVFLDPPHHFLIFFIFLNFTVLYLTDLEIFGFLRKVMGGVHTSNPMA